MFFQVPETESQVPGMSARCDLVPENIAVGHYGHRIVDEFLRVLVEHDGSNPFCDAQPCCWGLIIVASTNETVPDVIVEGDHPFSFHCLPNGVTITKVAIVEAIYSGQAGIWLLFETSDKTGDTDFGVSLVPYSGVN